MRRSESRTWASGAGLGTQPHVEGVFSSLALAGAHAEICAEEGRPTAQPEGRAMVMELRGNGVFQQRPRLG
jgi:hypothetical protein